MSARSLFLSIVVSAAGCSVALTAEPEISYEARATSETITIDGRLTEDTWRAAQAIPFMLPVSHKQPNTRTLGRLAWDEQALYVAFEAEDQDLQGELTEHDASVYKDDVLEAFLLPAESEHYMGLEINVLGTIYDAYGEEGRAWTCEGLRLGIEREGTLNDSSDKDEKWVMELAIPWDEFEGMSGPPSLDEAWRFHLARYDHSAYQPEGKELSSCAPLSEVNFHKKEDWIALEWRGD